jgi:hypothetical protein
MALELALDWIELVVLALASDWHRIGLVLDWHWHWHWIGMALHWVGLDWIDIRLALALALDWIGIGLEWIGIRLALAQALDWIGIGMDWY